LIKNSRNQHYCQTAVADDISCFCRWSQLP